MVCPGAGRKRRQRRLADDNGAVAINELVAAVGNALSGCS